MDYATGFYNVMNVVDNTDTELWNGVCIFYGDRVKYAIQDPSLPELRIITFKDDSSYISYKNDLFLSPNGDSFAECMSTLMEKFPFIREKILAAFDRPPK